MIYFDGVMIAFPGAAASAAVVAAAAAAAARSFLSFFIFLLFFDVVFCQVLEVFLEVWHVIFPNW